MSTVYVDRGAAWLTVAGGFVANFLLGGLAKSYGLVMEAFQEEFQSGSAYLLLAGGLIYTLMYCLSLVNHYISLRYGSRPVVLVGAFGCCISLLVAAYSPNIAVWVVAIGFGVGASLSCIYFTVFSVVGQCFRRYLGLANGLSVSGVSVGQMAFPSLITWLNRTYGTRGGTVVMSAICLHLLITAVLMPRHIVDPDSPRMSSIQDRNKVKRGRRFRTRRRKHTAESGELIKTREVVELTANSTLVSLDGADPGLITDKTSMLSDLDKKLLTNAMGDAPHPKPAPKESRIDVRGSSVTLDSRQATRLSHALLAVYILAKIFGDIGDVSVSFIAPTHGTKLKLSAITISRAIAVAGGVDLISRLGVGWLTDRPGCVGRRGPLLAITWLVEGLNALAFSELHRLAPRDDQDVSKTLLIGYFLCFGVHGICSGTAMTQMVVVLSDWVGPVRLPHSLAVTMVVLGVLISPGQFAIGYLADVTSNYVWPMRLCFLILIIAGLLLFMEFPVRWIHARSIAPHQLSLCPRRREKSNTNGIGCTQDGDCWQVVDSDSAEDMDNDGCAADDSLVNTANAHFVATGLTSIPLQLSLVDVRSTDQKPSEPLYICTQQHSEAWDDLGVV